MSNFEDHFPRLSPASVSPLRMRFDARLFLQNHPQMQPSDSFNLGSRDTTLPCGCLPDSIFYPSTIPVASVFQAWRKARSPQAGHATEMASFEAYKMLRCILDSPQSYFRDNSRQRARWKKYGIVPTHTLHCFHENVEFHFSAAVWGCKTPVN